MKLTLLLLSCSAFVGHAQCNNPITHTSGTQNINATLVTVTPTGSAIATTICSHDYWIGKNNEAGPVLASPGSFTYNFSPPATGISLSIDAIDNWTETEEVALYINGVHYNISQPGSGFNCLTPNLAMVTPSGNIGAMNLDAGSGWLNFELADLSIETFTIEDVIVNGSPNGSLYSINFCNTSLSNREFLNNELGIYPNPMDAYAQIHAPRISRNSELLICNALGQTVRTQSIFKPDFSISRDGLQSGIYSVIIREGSHTLYRTRLIVK